MYEEYYGFAEKPFSLTPDPKYLFRSQSHGDAFDLLQYAIERREGFVVVTGDIGTGKTTLCRALLEQIDRTTFTALVLNPFVSEEDLLKRILQDFGVFSRDDVKAGRLAVASKQELIDALYDFLLGLVPLKASAVLIIDEAQNLPLQVLEQIRILSNLETDKEKLLQIMLVGQLNLQTLLRSPELRQLDQRISIRYELKPLDAETAAAYVSHRLTIAGGRSSVSFSPTALAQVHKLSGGIPRLINLICDRALVAGYSLRAKRITPEMVRHAARTLDIHPNVLPQVAWFRRQAPIAAGALAILCGSVVAVGTSAVLYDRFGGSTLQASARTSGVQSVRPGFANRTRAASTNHTPRASANHSLPESADAATPVLTSRTLPAGTPLTVVAGSFPIAERDRIGALTDWIESTGEPVFYADVELSSGARWRRVLAGAYTEVDRAEHTARLLNAGSPGLDARVVGAADATGLNR